MQTGWEHDDHQSRREFERLRNRTSESTERAEETPSLRRGRPISSSQAPEQGPVGIRSPLETIEVSVNGSWWEIDRHFRVWVNGSPVEVRDNGETATVKDIHFEDTASVTWTVVRRGVDAVTVTAVSSGGGGGTYDWDIAGDTGGPSTIANGDQLNIVGGTNISTALTGTGPYTLTINNTAPVAPAYSWDVMADSLLTVGTVDTTETVQFLGADGVTTELITVGDHYLTIRRPLTIEDDDVAVGGTDTIFLNFDSQAETTTAQAVNFVVTDDGAGQRSVKAYVPSSAGSYEWYIDDNTSGSPATVANGDTVDIIAGTGIIVNRTGRAITIENNYAYSWFVNVDGGTNTEISDGEEVNFISGTDINIVRVGNNITINSTAVAASYDWDLQADTGGPSTVGTGALVDIAGGTGVDTALTGAGPFTVTINRPFTIEDDNVAVGGGDTLYLNFDSQTETTTAQAVNFVVTDDGTGQRSVKAYVPSSAGSYDWNVAGDTGGPSTIISGGQLNIVGGTNIATALTGTGPWTLTINNTYSYDWDVQADVGGPSTLGSGAVLDIAGGTGVDTVLTGAGPFTVTVNRPFTIEDDNVAVGGGDTLYLNFDSQAETTTAQAVNFVVTDDGTGQRSVKAYVPASAGSYDWDLQADTGGPSTIGSGAIVDIAGGVGVTTTLAGAGPYVVTIDRPLTIEDDNVAVGGTDTLFINFDSNSETTTAQAVNFVVTDDGAGQRTIRGFVPASGGSYDWTVAADSGSELVTSGSTITWAGGTNITTSYDAGTNTVTITAAAYPDYNWLLAAEETAGTANITDGLTVTFRGEDGITARRDGNDIIIGIDNEDPPWGTEQEKRRMTGYLEFDVGQADIFGGAPAYQYGVRRYMDIAHNWNLSNMNDFHLELTDVQLDNVGTLAHYRDEETYPPGLWTVPEVSPFINRPHWAAIDRDTIRVYATMTEEDTTMKFRYVLTEE